MQVHCWQVLRRASKLGNSGRGRGEAEDQTGLCRADLGFQLRKWLSGRVATTQGLGLPRLNFGKAQEA